MQYTFPGVSRQHHWAFSDPTTCCTMIRTTKRLRLYNRWNWTRLLRPLRAWARWHRDCISTCSIVLVQKCRRCKLISSILIIMVIVSSSSSSDKTLIMIHEKHQTTICIWCIIYPCIDDRAYTTLASHVPENPAIEALPSAMARAHAHYGKKEYVKRIIKKITCFLWNTKISIYSYQKYLKKDERIIIFHDDIMSILIR